MKTENLSGLIKIADEKAIKNQNFDQTTERHWTNAAKKLRIFQNTIARPTKKEFAGARPGKDYNDSRWKKLAPFKLDFGSKPGSSTAAWTTSTDDSGKQAILHINKDNIPEGDLIFPTLAHEYNHWQNGDVRYPSLLSTMFARSKHAKRNNEIGSGRSDKEKQTLADAYRFTKEDVGGGDADPVEEAGATNAEFRAMLWDSLSRQLGRDATYDEFKDYVRNLTYDQFFNDIYGKTNNEYFLNSLNHLPLGVENAKEYALKHFVPVSKPPKWTHFVPWTTEYERIRDRENDYNKHQLDRMINQELEKYKKALLEVAKNRQTGQLPIA